MDIPALVTKSALFYKLTRDFLNLANVKHMKKKNRCSELRGGGGGRPPPIINLGAEAPPPPPPPLFSPPLRWLRSSRNAWMFH